MLPVAEAWLGCLSVAFVCLTSGSGILAGYLFVMGKSLRQILNSLLVVGFTLALSASPMLSNASAQDAPTADAAAPTVAPQPAPAPDSPPQDTPASAPQNSSAQVGNPGGETSANNPGLDRTTAEIARTRKQLASLDDSIKKAMSDDDALVALAGKADDLNSSAAAISGRLKPHADELSARLAKLGPAPKDGQPPEAPIVAQERDKLTAAIAQLNVVMGDADNLTTAAARVSGQITEMRRRLFAETLFRRTELSLSTFSDAGQALVREAQSFRDALVSWATFAWKFKRVPLITAVALSLVSGLVLMLGGYRLFGRYFYRDETIEAPAYISRLSIAFWSTMIRTLSVAITLVISFFLLQNFNVLRPDIAPVFAAVFGFIGLVYFVARVVNAIFAPFEPSWRLVKLSNKGARSVGWCLLAISIVNGLDYVLNRISESMGSPVIVTVAKSFFAALIIGLVFIAVSFGKPILARSGDPDAPGRRWPHGMAIILRLIGVALILTALIGYVGLARFIALQLIVTSAVIVTMYLGILLGKAVSDQESFPETSVGRMLQKRLKISGAMLDQAGLVAGLAIYVFALMTGIPLILLSWGFHIQDLEIFFYRMFTEIRLGSIKISLVGILAGILFFIGGYLVTRWFQRWLDGNVMARGQVDLGVRNSVKTGIGYLGVAIAAVIGISAAGIDLSSLALVASALSVGIGFGLQNIVSNFVSGLILLVERPFKVGDWIVSGTSEGIVKRISVRATEIETFRQQSIIVPNSELINASVGNWTHRNRLARSEIPVSVGYDSDPAKVMAILLELVKAVPKVLRNPEPHVEFLRFGPSSLDFEMRFYIADLSDGMPIRNNLRIAILERFKKEGIIMPYPQQELHISRQVLRERAMEPSPVVEERDELPVAEAEVIPAPEIPAAGQQRGQRKADAKTRRPGS